MHFKGSTCSLPEPQNNTKRLISTTGGSRPKSTSFFSPCLILRRDKEVEKPQNSQKGNAEHSLHRGKSLLLRPVSLIAASFLPVPKELIPGDSNGQCHLNQLSPYLELSTLSLLYRTATSPIIYSSSAALKHLLRCHLSLAEH